MLQIVHRDVCAEMGHVGQRLMAVPSPSSQPGPVWEKCTKSGGTSEVPALRQL